MVERLGAGPATVSQLARPLEITLSAVVQHLAVLEAAGLVSSKKVGRTRTCELEPVGLRLAADWFAGQRAAWERRLDRLGAVLAEDLAAEHDNTDQEQANTDQERSTQ